MGAMEKVMSSCTPNFTLISSLLSPVMLGPGCSRGHQQCHHHCHFHPKAMECEGNHVLPRLYKEWGGIEGDWQGMHPSLGKYIVWPTIMQSAPAAPVAKRLGCQFQSSTLCKDFTEVVSVYLIPCLGVWCHNFKWTWILIIIIFWTLFLIKLLVFSSLNIGLWS